MELRKSCMPKSTEDYAATVSEIALYLYLFYYAGQAMAGI